MAARSTVLLAAPLALAISASAVAQPRTGEIRDNNFNWNFVQFGLENQDWNGFDRNALYGRLSWALDEHLVLRGALNLYDGDIDYRGLGLSVGLGFHTPLQQDLDLVVSGDILHDRYRVNPPGPGGSRSDNETGLRFAGGVRHATADNVELSGGVFLLRYDGESELGLYGEAALKVSDTVQVGADLQLSGDYDAIGIFGRVKF